jgi:hypothetical protein
MYLGLAPIVRVFVPITHRGLGLGFGLGLLIGLAGGRPPLVLHPHP